MEEKKNKMIVEMVEKLRQMDSNSLVIMKASVDILAAKEACEDWKYRCWIMEAIALISMLCNIWQACR